MAARPHLALLLASVAAASTATGCLSAEEAPSSESASSVSQAIYSGVLDTDASANPAVVSLRVGTGPRFELCSATLVADNLLLTARHCVSKNLQPTVTCDASGQSANGDHLGDDFPLETIGVYMGERPMFAGAPDAKVSQIVHNNSTILCNADIAFLVLDRALSNVEPMRVRLRGRVQPGERIRTVGYGENNVNEPIGTRLRKENLEVLAQGSGLSPSETPLGSKEFEVGLSICQGDSGGPAISEETGAVVGVVSRGGKCTDTFGHIYTRTSGFVGLLRAAFAAAGQDLALASEEPGLDPDVLQEEVEIPAATSTRRSRNSASPGQTRSSGCSAAPGSTSGVPLGLFGLGVVFVLRRGRSGNVRRGTRTGQ